MKSSFLLLPMAALVLTACISGTPAPVVNAQDNNELSPGVMQPVEGTGATSSGWQSDIQPVAMPSSMQTAPVAIPQPVYQAPPQPIATAQPQPIKPVVSVPKPVVPEKKVPQNFTIPRDAKNAPIYSQIDKGFYQGNTYTVRKGDTMFLIAYISGKDVKEVAALNGLSEPYNLVIGQTLKLSNERMPVQPAPQPVKVVEPQVTYTQGANGTAYGSDGTIKGPIKAAEGIAPAVKTTTGGVVAAPAAMPKVTASTAPTAVETPVNTPVATSSVSWQWPTQGRIIAGFSPVDGGNKGIDIAGSKGQAVVATAAGRVVYAGNALRGYGNLIIIKHNDDFLSAYAHNDTILVADQAQVKAGQRIATMGNTGTDNVKLHFEIRYKGKSVDPIRYLPKR